MPLSRRTFLRGAGIALSLPMLDAMVPAFRRSAYAAQTGTPRRMIAVQTNMGILSQHFFPTTTGADFELTPYLDLLKNFKSKMTVLGGVSHPDVDGAHEAERSFLSAAPHPGGAGFKNSISLDQYAAELLGPVTRFPSFVLDVNAESTQGMAFSRSGVKVPAEKSPAKLYEKMFLQGKPSEVEARIADELQSLRLQMIEEAAATSRLGELALARMDLDSAADYFADAAGQLPASEAALELDYRQKQAEALAAKAETTGDARALQASAQAFRKCRSLVTTATASRTRTRISVGLGDMLTALAARHPNETIELEEAITAYADAIATVDQATKPMQWALVQLSHAAALIELGKRFDRHRHWTQAATVLMPALEVFESRNAMDLAEAARAKLRDIAGGLADVPAQGLLSRPA